MADFKQTLRSLSERLSKLAGQVADQTQPKVKSGAGAIETYLNKGLSAALGLVDRLRGKK